MMSNVFFDELDYPVVRLYYRQVDLLNYVLKSLL